MNTIIQHQYPVFELYQGLRAELLETFSDADLALTPGGANPTLGELCIAIGETEQSYIESFKSFTQDFSEIRPHPESAHTVAGLQAWYARLDAELRQVVEGLTEEEVQNHLIDRGPDFKVPPHIQLEIYKEALLIFYGKVSVYLKAAGKPLPERFAIWIE